MHNEPLWLLNFSVDTLLTIILCGLYIKAVLALITYCYKKSLTNRLYAIPAVTLLFGSILVCILINAVIRFIVSNIGG